MKTTDLDLIQPGKRLQPMPQTPDAPGVAVIDMVPSLVGLETILVPIDFSAVSEKAIAYAAAFARQFGAKITLLHAIEFPPETFVTCREALESARPSISANAKSRLEMIAAGKVPADIRAQVEVRWGTPWHVIEAVARELHADLIVLTTYGLSSIRHVLLGSTAERVGRYAPCPVLIVREREHDFVSAYGHEPQGARAVFFPNPKQASAERNHAMTTSDQTTAPAAPRWEDALDTQRPAAKGDTIDLVPQILHLKNILVPIDFSATAEKALVYAMPFAEQFGAKLTLLHIVDLTARQIEYGLYEFDSADCNTAAQQKLDGVARERIPATLPEPAATAIRAGIPWLEICNVAKDIAADLIILTTHGYTGLKRVFLGSTAERVVRHAPCPVLVVREKEHEFVPNAAEK